MNETLLTEHVLFVTAINFVVDMRVFRDALKSLGMAIKLGFSANNPIADWVYQIIADPTVGDFFMLSIPIAAIERVIFTIIAIVVGVGVVMTLGKSLLAPTETRLENEESLADN